MTLPRITIIMPSLNQAEFLEEAIESVLDQNYPQLEFMVFDGGSTDGSREIIQGYERHLTYWQSRPDGGQSAAIDQGMTRATGALCGWLNSDDVLFPGSLRCVADYFLEFPEGELFSGNMAFMDIQGKITRFLRMPPQAAYFARLGVFAVSGPGSFYRPSAYRRLGGVRQDFHLVMDTDLYLRLLLEGGRHIYIDRYLAAFRRYRSQKTSALLTRMYAEERLMAEKLRAHGVDYRSAGALWVYYMWQTLNGNYLKKRLHLLTSKGQHWRSWVARYAEGRNNCHGREKWVI